MMLASRWTNVILIVIGVGLVISAFTVGRGSILPNAIVDLILLLRGSRPKVQPLPIVYTGVAAALLALFVDLRSIRGGFETLTSAIVLALLAMMLFWERIPILRRDVVNGTKH